MSTLFKVTSYVPVNVGDAYGGGYFAGYLSLTADGNPTHALIVAPRATGATGGTYPNASNYAWTINGNAPDGVNYSNNFTGGTVTGSITGTTMTITAVSSGRVRPGHTITGTTVAVNTTVVSQISGTTNGVGDYTVSTSQTVTSRTLTAAASSSDGIANAIVLKDIDNTVGSGSTVFPAANYCEALSINGLTDWYLPSQNELEIAYFNLKPSNAPNLTANNNLNAVPRRPLPHAPLFPRQTTLTAWNTTAEGFILDTHWTSTADGTNTNASFISFVDGVGGSSKLSSIRVRAFRRIAL